MSVIPRVKIFLDTIEKEKRELEERNSSNNSNSTLSDSHGSSQE